MTYNMRINVRNHRSDVYSNNTTSLYSNNTARLYILARCVYENFEFSLGYIPAEEIRDGAY